MKSIAFWPKNKQVVGRGRDVEEKVYKSSHKKMWLTSGSGSTKVLAETQRKYGKDKARNEPAQAECPEGQAKAFGLNL